VEGVTGSRVELLRSFQSTQLFLDTTDNAASRLQSPIMAHNLLDEAGMLKPLYVLMVQHCMARPPRLDHAKRLATELLHFPNIPASVRARCHFTLALSDPDEVYSHLESYSHVVKATEAVLEANDEEESWDVEGMRPSTLAFFAGLTCKIIKTLCQTVRAVGATDVMEAAWNRGKTSVNEGGLALAHDAEGGAVPNQPGWGADDTDTTEQSLNSDGTFLRLSSCATLPSLARRS